MSSLARQIAEIGHLGPEYYLAIEYDLACAQLNAPLNSRDQIHWISYFPWLKERLSEAQNHRCCWCGVRMGETGQKRHRPTFEHVIPLSKGGADTIDNIAIACLGCNQNRSDSSLKDILERNHSG